LGSNFLADKLQCVFYSVVKTLWEENTTALII